MPRPTSDAVRAEFVEIATRRFATQGFAGTSLEDIADEAGYSKAAVLYHFGSKTDLLAAAVEQHVAAIDELVTDLEGRPDTPDRVEQTIEALTRFVVQRHSAAPTLPLSQGPELAHLLASHPDRVSTYADLRRRVIRLLVGDHPTLEQRVRLTLVFAGLPLAMAELHDVPADDLYDPLCGALRGAIGSERT